MTDDGRWPELPYAAWQDTCATLQLWTQVIGKVRLALTPWLNHSWHVTLNLTARGLTTGPITHGGRTLVGRTRAAVQSAVAMRDCASSVPVMPSAC